MNCDIQAGREQMQIYGDSSRKARIEKDFFGEVERELPLIERELQLSDTRIAVKRYVYCR